NTRTTETINIDTWVGGRKMAPFVLPGAEAIPVPGMSKTFRQVTAPNIRIKKAFSLQDRLFSRTPGTAIFVSDSGSQLSEVERSIAMDVQYMRDQIDDTIDWMCASALSGAVTYSTADFTPGELTMGDAFTIDYRMPAANKVTLSGNDTWDTAEASATETPKQTLRRFQKLMDARGYSAITDCIMGSDAAVAFEEHFSLKAHLDNRRTEIGGPLSLVQGFTGQGARYIGRFYGINWWEYSRQVTDPFGATKNLIQPGRAHFLSASGTGEFDLEFGAIQDFKAYSEGNIATEYFSKSWEKEDPSVLMHLAHSRPLPVLRRPDAIGYADVV
ncbi:MAG TPA: hypothetical protein DF699_06240, partial [Phycisphaerales bacterium]|nr:hypothetical protein [Phycisphaerales bacterium]